MARTIPEGRAFENCPEGTHNATAVGFIDLGTQTVKWKDKESEARKCRIIYEVSGETQENGEPFLLDKEYIFSKGSKTLNADLKAMFGKAYNPSGDFDMDTVLGKGCQIAVVHNESKTTGKTYANVKSVIALGKDSKGNTIKLPKPVTPLKSFYLNEEDFDQDTFDSLSDFHKGIIAKSNEYGEFVQLSNEQPAAKKQTAAKKAPAKKAAKKR